MNFCGPTNYQMKITILQGAFLPVPPVLGGGVEKIWFALGKEFVRKGHKVTHISRNYEEFASEEFIGGVHHLRVRGYDTPRSMAVTKWRDLLYTRRAAKLLPEADILVTNTFWAPLLSRDSRNGKICVHVARYPKGQMRLYRAAARLHTVSQAVRDAICKEVPLMADSVRVIPNFVEGSSQQVDSERKVAEILYVGRIHPEKGTHLLLKAFTRLVDEGLRTWKLRIVGPWEVKLGGGGEHYFNSLRKETERLGPRIVWNGPVFDTSELRSLYQQSTIFVYPSLAERGETFGLAPLEAMGEGCPPIVSSLECFQDFVTSGQNGWIFNHRSSDAENNLAYAIRDAINNKVHLSVIRANAFRTAQEFSLSNIAGRYLSDFEQLVAR